MQGINPPSGASNNDPENPLQELFTLEIACELIGETEQEEGIQVIKQDGE